MEEKELNVNDSKKLIIGISILFCTVILIIGGTLAFFTQSDTKEIGNIVTENINGTLKFYDNNDYMFGNFIPVNEEDVIKFASKTTDKCHYQDDMYACNMYEFTITNDSNVAQELKITLNPTKNEFSNLYYMLFEKNKDNISIDSVPVNKDKIVETNSNIMVDKLILGPEQSKIYTIIYYVKNLDTDQTLQDAGKQFYANVKVDSITTGMYAGTLMESRCYEYEQITEGDYVGTYKLTKFNGIDENGVADTTCGVIKNEEFYSVNVPSKLKDEEGNQLEISTLGNKLFIGADFVNETLLPSAYINNIELEEGIKEIESGKYEEKDDDLGTFFYMGTGPMFEGGSIEEINVKIKLPQTLEKIGDAAFLVCFFKEITIPKNVISIGKYAFATNSNLTNLIFEEGSKLKIIDVEAFSSTGLIEVEIPYSVNYIGKQAFDYINTLEKIIFLGDLESDLNPLTIDNKAFYMSNLNYSTYDNPLVIPARVIFIGDDAFRGDASTNNDLKFIKFMGATDALNKLGNNWYKTNVVEYIKSKDEYVID